ncbi:MAG TPA: hypothetical protein VJ960_00150, partial [Oceanipulchritudo sp.]|nr:hypothetical protein [Oceanipulchritudo sp.]
VPVMTNGYLVEGESMFLADLLLAYEFEVKWGSNSVGVDLQLDISNLFDSDKDQLYDAAWWDSGRASRIGLQEPRRINVTATFSF